ncbi:hypothetical protein [Natrinema halophilum]|uniref:hypothetical protein n=1 Tax=Natrinema halophilum TaxID=1699371 RepID=UPI001F239336|nr:hypothetical protein [Natrinema halophilum]UHQ96053.1 hypothetical protein HYG82_20960 [Natrinema halophilum]
MCATFSDDDVDKPVENEAGEEVGVIAAVAEDVARVRPNPSAVDSIKSSLGWEKVAEHPVTLDRASVREITADVVRLDGELLVNEEPDAGYEADRDPETDRASRTSGIDETGVSDAMASDEQRAPADDLDAIEERGRGVEVDPTELSDRDPGLSTRSNEDDQRTDAAVEPDETANRTDAAVEPDETANRTDAAVEPDETANRTDAAVEPDETANRTDAAVEPSSIRESEATDRGPTTEDGARGVEGSPEEKRLTDAETEDNADGDG